MKINWREEVAASWEIGRDRRQISLRSDVEDEIHSDDDVEEEVTVEEPVTWRDKNYYYLLFIYLLASNKIQMMQ